MSLPTASIPLSSGNGVTTCDDHTVRIRAIRACITCRVRKIRCDQVRPSCGSCVKGTVPCEYPSQTRRPPRTRQPDAVLVQRLGRLEKIIEGLSAGRLGPNQQRQDGKRDGNSPSLAPGSEQGMAYSSELESLEDIEAGLGQMLLSGGKSRYVGRRYVGPNFWAVLSEEAADLNSLLYETQEDEIREHEEMAPGPGSFFSHCLGDFKDLSMFHVSVEMSRALYQRFGSAVDPLVRILHKPSFEKLLALFHQNGACSTYGLGGGFEALIFSVYFGAVISMKNNDVLNLFGVDRATIIERFIFAIEQALTNVRFLQSEELMPLQACVLFNVCLRGVADTRSLLVLVAAVVRVAQSLGLHRDGSLFGISAFETEIRRRIWYEICLLDVRTAEDHGCNPSITTTSYDTQMPLNINDQDLSEDPNAPPPVARSEFTEMTFCLVGYEMLDCYDFLFRNEPGAAKCPHAIKITLQEKEEKLRTTKRRIEAKYSTWLEGPEKLKMAVFILSRIVIRKALISLYHPLRHFKAGELLSHELKEKLFITAIESLEFELSFHDTPGREECHWDWLFDKHSQSHALALILLELNERPMSDSSGLFDRGWNIVKAFTDPNGPKGYQKGDPSLFKLMEKLRDKMMRRKDNALYATIPLELVEQLAHEPGSTPPMDWTEWDEMFRPITTCF